MSSGRRFTKSCGFTLAFVCFTSPACGGTISVRRGSYQRVVAEDVIERRPATEMGDVTYRADAGRLTLRIMQKRTCETLVMEHFEVVDEMEKQTKDKTWPAIWTLAVPTTLLGGGLMVASRYQPTTGTDSDGKATNPRTDMLVGGAALVGISAALVAAVMPITGASEVVSGRGNRVLTRSAPCGVRAFEGRIEVVNLDTGQSAFTRTGSDGRAMVEAADLGGRVAGQHIAIRAPAIGLEAEIETDQGAD